MKNKYGPSPLAEVYKMWCGFSAQLKEIFTIQAYPACPMSKMIELDKQEENTFLETEQYPQTLESIYAGLGIPKELWPEEFIKKEEECQNQVEKQ